jgi:hypothetical protein
MADGPSDPVDGRLRHQNERLRHHRRRRQSGQWCSHSFPHLDRKTPESCLMRRAPPGTDGPYDPVDGRPTRFSRTESSGSATSHQRLITSLALSIAATASLMARRPPPQIASPSWRRPCAPDRRGACRRPRSFEFGNQVLISSHRKLLSSVRWPIACAMQHGVLLWVG